MAETVVDNATTVCRQDEFCDCETCEPDFNTYETRIPKYFPGTVGSVRERTVAKARYKCYLDVNDVVRELRIIDIEVRLERTHAQNLAEIAAGPGVDGGGGCFHRTESTS